MGFGVHISGHTVGEIHTISEQTDFDKSNTNNVAEYRALCLGLEWLIENGYHENPVQVFGDSMLVINQMNGTWRARGGRYFSEYLRACELRDQFKQISFQWVERARNQIADDLSKSVTV